MMNPPRTITEIKYRPGKTPLQWTCEVVELHAPEWVRLRYVSDQPYRIEGTELPVGTVTDAMYWADRPYHVWRFTGPDGAHLGYRFDVCAYTHIWPEKLIWTDLELDLWISADGQPHWQDEDEMAQLVRMEHLSREELALANEAKARLDREWREVIREVYGEELPPATG